MQDLFCARVLGVVCFCALKFAEREISLFRDHSSPPPAFLAHMPFGDPRMPSMMSLSVARRRTIRVSAPTCTYDVHSARPMHRQDASTDPSGFKYQPQRHPSPRHRMPIFLCLLLERKLLGERVFWKNLRISPGFKRSECSTMSISRQLLISSLNRRSYRVAARAPL